MSFILKDNIEVLWPVLVKSPADHGEVREELIEICFVSEPAPAMQKFLEDLNDLAFDMEEKNRTEKAQKLWAKKIKGFSLIYLDDAKTKELSFNKKNLQALLNNSFILQALPEAYQNFCTGHVEKNLKRLLDLASTAPAQSK